MTRNCFDNVIFLSLVFTPQCSVLVKPFSCSACYSLKWGIIFCCNFFLVLGCGLVSLAVFCGSAPSSTMESEVCTFPNDILVCGVSWFFHSKEKLLVLLFFYRISTSNWNMWFSLPSYANSTKCTCVLFYLQLLDEFYGERTELYKLHFLPSGTPCRRAKENEMHIREWEMCGITGTILILIASCNTDLSIMIHITQLGTTTIKQVIPIIEAWQQFWGNFLQVDQ